MYLLYVDESGDVDDPLIDHFVLGGFAILERQTHWLAAELDKIASRFDPADPQSIELYGNPMIQGSKGWKSFPQSKASRLIQLADLISYSVFRAVEKRDERFLPIIAHKFDREGDQNYGLVHWRRRDVLSVRQTVTTTLMSAEGGTFTSNVSEEG